MSDGLRGAINDVADFHLACKLPILSKPKLPPIDRQRFRLDLIQEEKDELLYAVYRGDLAEIADGLGDLIYVCIGMALEYGIPLDMVWDEIQRSNMAKRGPDGRVRKREDGKILKPEGWTAPDIKGVLESCND